MQKPKTASITRRVTALDVARQAGVSRSAVSRAFTPGASISEKKRQAILQVAEQLGYQPNALAAGLNQRSANLVGIITGNLSSHYDATLTARLVEKLLSIGKLAVVITGQSEDITKADISNMLAYPLDAIIVRAGSVDENVAEQCLKLNVPLILSGRVLAMDGVDCVSLDNVAGSKLAVETLLKQQCTKIAYLGGNKALMSEKERYQGFLEALTAADRAPAGMAWGNFDFQQGLEAALSLLSGPEHERPDGLFCCNDAMALGALNAARNILNLRVPEDVGIIGFDNVEMAAWPCFELTTISNPVDKTVQEIMALLQSRLHAPERAARIVRLQPELICRATHGKSNM